MKAPHWAKRKTELLREVRYPLLFHMLDVAIVTRQLWEKSLHSGARHLFAEQLHLSESEAATWISFWSGLHDIGKASPVFQRKSEVVKHQLESIGFVFESHVTDIPHGVITAYVFPDLVVSASPNQKFPGDMAQFIGLAIGGHHGTFSINEPKYIQKGDSEWDSTRTALTVQLASLLNISSLPAPQYVNDNAFYMMLAGLTSVADWIGSSEDFFPLEVEHSPEEHLTYARQQAGKIVHSLGWDGWKPPVQPATLQKLFPTIIDNPRPLQVKVSELAETLANRPGLVIIEAPMGEGKTEAAMYLADRWAALLGQKGTYFALPTQATSNQMFGRVKEFLETRYPRLAVNLQLIHGGALLSEEFSELRIGVGDNEDDDASPAGIIAAEWFLPKKRGLLAPFGVGTIDQALLSVLQTRHFFVRLFGLAQKTVIIDEVHAYDMYMSTLLEELIGWLRAVGSSVVLLSATLPASKRKALVKAYAGDAIQLAPSTYPRVTWVSGPEVVVDGFEATRHVELHIRHIRDNPEVLVNNLRLAITDGGCVAIVCNTVKRAQETYTTLKQAGLVKPNELMLLHARYPYEERLERENAILCNFGKGGKRPERAILVATQIIEQSLDVDFDLVITDLAPADLVIQRSGRVHRHDNPRPASMTQPALWIRMPDTNKSGLPEFGGSAFVYSEYFLLFSYLHLKDRTSIFLPDDIQDIIEKVYGNPEGPWPSRAFGDAVHSASEKMKEEIGEKVFSAKVNLVPKHDDRDPFEFFSSSNQELEEDNPEIHRSLQALTRLVEPSVQVVCLFKSADETFLHEGEQSPVDIGQKPEGELIKEFLRRSLTITDKRVVFKLIDQRPPPVWKRCPALRHHRLLEFENGIAKVANYLLHLDDELGLRIEDPEDQREREE